MKLKNFDKDKRRYDTLDSVRGICVIGMIAYHTVFDIFYLFGLDFISSFMISLNIVRDIGAALFIFMSGFTFCMTKKHILHFAVLTVCGGVITLVTAVIMPDCFVICGILSFLGLAAIIMYGLDFLLKHVSAAAGFAVNILLFGFFYFVNYGYHGTYYTVWYVFPRELYRNYITAVAGFPFNGFQSSDYFSLLPWIFIYTAGYFAFRLLNNNFLKSRFAFIKIPFICALGRYSLPIYLAHQPLIFGIVYLCSIL